MARQRIANFAQFVSKATCLKITGWSVKYSQESMLECLSSFGQVQYFVHYPQLNTTYVTMRVAGYRTSSIQDVLVTNFPRARVEFLSTNDILTSESGLEMPEVTAFLSSRRFFTETAIYTELKQFGNLRALNYSYSTKCQKWFCKASFYEQYSLDQVLSNKQSGKHTLCDGNQLKLERVRGDFTASRLRHACEAQKTRDQISGEIQQNTTIQPLTEVCRLETAAKSRSHSLSLRPTRSCDKTQIEYLPKYTTFRNSNLCIENALKIHRSRRLAKGETNVRSKSESKPPREHIQIRLASSISRSTSSTRKMVLNTYTFDETELLFIEIGTSNPNIEYTYVPISSQQHYNELIKDRLSYLSLDDLSDGYSAMEETAEFQPVKEETFKVFSTRGSDKEVSLVPMTKYSSDAERSLPKNISDYRFDFIFGSNSGIKIGSKMHMMAGNGLIMAGRSQTTHLEYFTFPSF